MFGKGKIADNEETEIRAITKTKTSVERMAMELTGTISIRMAMKWLTTMWTTTMKNVIADIKDFLHIPKTILQKMPLILKNNPEDKTKVETMTIMLTPLVTT